jgi:bifunctional UDP-N-acetylglucosamine pyrophosphorylase/glucosamine-1-phosphate N-acetyltransferase
MRSAVPKFLHPLAGVPLIEHVLRAAEALEPACIVVTIGPHTQVVRDVLGERADYALQPDARGTADAVRCALARLRPDVERVLVLYADVPLIEPERLAALVDVAEERQALIAALAFTLDDPGSYGRFQYDGDRVSGVIEAADDNRIYSEPVVCNSGIGCFHYAWLAQQLPQVPLSRKGEYYLTDLFSMAAREDHPHPIVLLDAPLESVSGVDDRVKLAAAERSMRRRINERWMRAGVTLVDPDHTYIDVDVVLAPDSRIEPGSTLRGATVVGPRCTIGPASVLEDVVLGNDVAVYSSWITGSVIGDGVDVGPYAHLRPGSVVEAGVHIGNYVETKNARIGAGTAVGHFSYLGDAEIGRGVNVGAGTVTCNYDGVAKHRTQVGDGAFLGSDTMLIAPVEVGEGARTGAGSVVNRDVPPGRTVAGVPARVVGPKREPDTPE